MSTAELVISGVTKRFGDFTAVSNVSLEIETGSIHSVIGPNGAGKTTLFNCLSGEVIPEQGQILLRGRDITRLPSHRRVAAGVARSFQITSLFPELSVETNLKIAARGRHSARAINFWSQESNDDEACRTAARVMDRLAISGLAKARVCELSHGQQRALEVAMALALQPRVILLDEPTSGMGVDDLPAMRKLVRSLGGDHTVVLVEHNMDIVMGISDTISVMAQGSLLCNGTPREVQADPRVRDVYLGEDQDA